MSGVLDMMKDPDYRLETIHRNAGEIARFSEFLREGNHCTNWEPEDQVQIVEKESSPEEVFQADQIIVAFNHARVKLNRQIRARLGFPPETPIIGDRIMCLKNNKDLGIYNGLQGEITAINPKTLVFTVDDVDHEVAYDLSSFNCEKHQSLFEQGRLDWTPFDYSYAATCHKCVHPDTLVETTEGLLPIADIAAEGVIATPNGAKRYHNFVVNPEGPALMVVTEHGYTVTVTPDHKVEAWDGEAYSLVTAEQLSEGQYLRVKLGHALEPMIAELPAVEKGDVRARKVANPAFDTELAEFFGLMVADGTVFRTGIRLAKRHKDVLDRFEYLCQQLFDCKPRRITIGNTSAIEVSSTVLASWLGLVGGMDPNNKMVPDCILRSPLNIQRAFIRGIMEDGGVGLMRDGSFNYLQFTSMVPRVLEVIKVMLLRMGIVTSSSDRSLYLYGTSAVRFREQIGFVSQFKNERLLRARLGERYSVLPVSKKEASWLKPYLNHRDMSNVLCRGYVSRSKAPGLPFITERMGYYHDRIKLIEPTMCPSMCIEVPDGHRFLQNGFPFGNCQGDEADFVAVIEQRCGAWDHRRWTYTAASRAKKRLLWIY
jgi:intein/homing endonuclease